MYTLSFLVIYPLNCHFYKCQPNTQLFQKTLFNSFYQTLSFLKMHFFIMHFLKTPLFHYVVLQKAELNSPLIQPSQQTTTINMIMLSNVHMALTFLKHISYENKVTIKLIVILKKSQKTCNSLRIIRTSYSNECLEMQVI